MYMWQSRIENEHYSVAYFDHTRTFTTLYLRTSVKGGAHTCCVEASHIDILSPALNGSSEIRRFEHAYAIEIRDGITFVFYSGLPHIVLFWP